MRLLFPVTEGVGKRKTAIDSHSPETGDSIYDVEKRPLELKSGKEEGVEDKSKPLWFRILNWGVEAGGIAPVPIEKRTDTRHVNLFTVWFTALLCLLP